MNNKILLSAASLLLAGNMYSTPANSAIDLSIGGEVKLTALMDDKCFTEATATNIEGIIERVGATTISTDDRAANDYITSLGHADVNFVTLDADIGGGVGDDPNGVRVTDGIPDDIDKNIVADVGYAANPCGTGTTTDRNGIDWGYGKKLTISASGTLANGLGISFSDDLNLATIDDEQGAFALTLDSAVGSLTFKNGGGDAVGKARVAGDADYSVTGDNLGFHGSKTTGHGGMGILWTAPSVGGLDLYVGWSPNSGGDGLDDAKYENTFSVAAVMDVSGMSIGAGYAAANESNSACATLAADTYAAANAEVSAYDVVDQIWKGDYCGDQTLMHIAASMSVGDLGLGVGYSVLDTDEADKTVMHIDASTSMSGYDLGVGYRQTTKDYAYGTIEDTQNVLSVSLGTSLGDGVDFGLAYSTNNVDLAANTGANGDTSNYFAEASLTFGF
jgi:hypothetical protein